LSQLRNPPQKPKKLEWLKVDAFLIFTITPGDVPLYYDDVDMWIAEFLLTFNRGW
jgi:hypothetical protein